MLCESCQVKLPTLHTRTLRVNSELHQLGLEYHETLSYSLNVIDRILSKHNFRQTEGTSIFTGFEGKLHEEVGEGKWLSVSWHRMDSGRYEIVAYVN